MLHHGQGKKSFVFPLKISRGDSFSWKGFKALSRLPAPIARIRGSFFLSPLKDFSSAVSGFPCAFQKAVKFAQMQSQVVNFAHFLRQAQLHLKNPAFWQEPRTDVPRCSPEPIYSPFHLQKKINSVFPPPLFLFFVRYSFFCAPKNEQPFFAFSSFYPSVSERCDVPENNQRDGLFCWGGCCFSIASPHIKAGVPLHAMDSKQH